MGRFIGGRRREAGSDDKGVLVELDRTDAWILATVVFIIVFVFSLVTSAVLYVFLGLYFNAFSIFGGSSGFFDLLFLVFVALSGWGAYGLSRKTFQAVLAHADSQ